MIATESPSYKPNFFILFGRLDKEEFDDLLAIVLLYEHTFNGCSASNEKSINDRSILTLR
jgi:hypothetical protein